MPRLRQVPRSSDNPPIVQRMYDFLFGDRDPVREPPRPLVVLVQARDVVVERVDASGGEDTCLAHATAERFAVPLGFVDQLARSDERRPDGGTQSLAETNADRIEMLSPFGERNSGRDRGIPQARGN